MAGTYLASSWTEVTISDGLILVFINGLTVHKR